MSEITNTPEVTDTSDILPVENYRTLAQAQAATDWYVNVKVHNNTKWDISFSQRILAAAGKIEVEPDSKVNANSTGSGGKYDAPFGPYGVSALICYNSPSSDYKFACCFVMPYIGSNSANVRIIDGTASVNQALFNSMDGSSTTSTEKKFKVDGTEYTFKLSCSIGGGTTPTVNLYINYT